MSEDLLVSDDDVSLLDPVPLWCFFEECFFVVVLVEVSVEPEPVEPLMPLGELDEPVSLLMPVDDPLLPVPVDGELEEPLVSLELPEPIELPEPVEELPEPIELPELPAAPLDMMSIVCALTVSPEPEKLARTRSPSLMSSMEAREPSFITCVLESTLSFLSLPERVSSFFDRSKFWTRPLSVSKWPLVLLPDGLADDVAPPVLLPMLPVLVEDDPLPIDLSELLLPIDPWLESWVEPLIPVPGLLELPL